MTAAERLPIVTEHTARRRRHRIRRYIAALYRQEAMERGAPDASATTPRWSAS